MDSIFSTYSTGENRVTATLVAVLRSLSLDRMTRLLGRLLGDPELSLINFRNQPSKGGAGIPDAVIESSLQLLIETKIERNTVSLPQIERHLLRLNPAASGAKSNFLLVLTPDDMKPAILEKSPDERIAWASFAMLDEAIDEMLDDKYEVFSEREAFLLREFQRMLDNEGLLTHPYDVAIVAARRAWPMYQELHAYTCLPHRSFQQVGRLGFYTNGAIQPLVPKIYEAREEVEIRANAYEGRLGTIINRMIEMKSWQEGTTCKVLILSAPDSEDTLVLPAPIINNKRSKTGKPTAFTMGQRYVASEALKTVKMTAELDSSDQ